jgi:lysozyme family protein
MGYMAGTSTKQAVVSDQSVIDMILLSEGSGYTNDPNDAGGPTRYGITLADLQEWHRGVAVTEKDVQQLSRDDAEAIYRVKYLRPFDALPDDIRPNVVDMGVNAGVQRAAKLLQQLLGATVDGWIGPETLSLLKTFGDRLPIMYVAARLIYYEQVIEAKPQNLKWRNGWRNRAIRFLPDQIKWNGSLPAPTPAASAKMARAA